MPDLVLKSYLVSTNYEKTTHVQHKIFVLLCTGNRLASLAEANLLVKNGETARSLRRHACTLLNILHSVDAAADAWMALPYR